MIQKGSLVEITAFSHQRECSIGYVIENFGRSVFVLTLDGIVFIVHEDDLIIKKEEGPGLEQFRYTPHHEAQQPYGREVGTGVGRGHRPHSESGR